MGATTNSFGQTGAAGDAAVTPLSAFIFFELNLLDMVHCYKCSMEGQNVDVLI